MSTPPQASVVDALWARRGFCDVTNVGQGATCQISDNLGSWQLPHEEGVSLLTRCLHRCAMCARCHYVSVSRIGRDCSWFRSCDALQTGDDIQGYTQKHFTYQVRSHDGWLHERASKVMMRGNATLEGERIRVVDTSLDMVCFGMRCMSWAQAFTAGRAPGGWMASLPPLVSMSESDDCGLPRGCPHGIHAASRPAQWTRARSNLRECGRCAEFTTSSGPRFNLSIAWSPQRGGREQFRHWRARVRRAAQTLDKKTGPTRRHGGHATTYSAIRMTESAGIFGPVEAEGECAYVYMCMCICACACACACDGLLFAVPRQAECVAGRPPSSSRCTQSERGRLLALLRWWERLLPHCLVRRQGMRIARLCAAMVRTGQHALLNQPHRRAAPRSTSLHDARFLSTSLERGDGDE